MKKKDARADVDLGDKWESMMEKKENGFLLIIKIRKKRFGPVPLARSRS